MEIMGGGQRGFMRAFYPVLILEIIMVLFVCFYFGSGLVKEWTWGYCHCLQLISSVSVESAYVVGTRAHTYCSSDVSLGPSWPMDVWC